MQVTARYLVSVDPEHCKGCELCVAVCPKQALAMSGGLNRRGYHYVEFRQPELCSGCLQCAQICPDCAIAIEEEAAADG